MQGSQEWIAAYLSASYLIVFEVVIEANGEAAPRERKGEIGQT